MALLLDAYVSEIDRTLGLEARTKIIFIRVRIHELKNGIDLQFLFDDMRDLPRTERLQEVKSLKLPRGTIIGKRDVSLGFGLMRVHFHVRLTKLPKELRQLRHAIRSHVSKFQDVDSLIVRSENRLSELRAVRTRARDLTRDTLIDIGLRRHLDEGITSEKPLRELRKKLLSQLRRYKYRKPLFHGLGIGTELRQIAIAKKVDLFVSYSSDGYLSEHARVSLWESKTPFS